MFIKKMIVKASVNSNPNFKLSDHTWKDFDISNNLYTEKHHSSEYQVDGNSRFSSFTEAYETSIKNKNVYKLSYVDKKNNPHRWVRTLKKTVVELAKLNVVPGNVAYNDDFYWIDKPILIKNKELVIPYQKIFTNNEFVNFLS